MAKIKLSKEEKEAQKARQQQIRQLWQSAGIKDIAGVETWYKRYIQQFFEIEQNIEYVLFKRIVCI